MLFYIFYYKTMLKYKLSYFALTFVIVCEKMILFSLPDGAFIMASHSFSPFRPLTDWPRWGVDNLKEKAPVATGANLRQPCWFLFSRFFLLKDR